MLKLLLDEHMPRYFREGLLRRLPELSILMVGDEEAPTRGTLDPDLLVWCEVNEFVLVTNNRKTMPAHLGDHLALGRHVPGILALRKRANVGKVLDHLELIAGASWPEENRDRIRYVPLNPREL